MHSSPDRCGSPTQAELKGNFDSNVARLTPERCQVMGITAGQLRLLANRWQRQNAEHIHDNEVSDVTDVDLPHMQDTGALCPRPYVIRGLCPAGLLLRVHAATVDVFNGYSPRLYVLEPSIGQVVAALHTHDLGDVLDDNRVVILVGSDLVRRLEAILDDDAGSVSLPKYDLAQPSGLSISSEQLNEMIARIDQKRTERTLQFHQRAEAVYADRNAAWWGSRYEKALDGDGPALRVLIPVSRYSTYVRHAAAQLARALERLGCETRILTETDSHSVLPASAYAREFAEWQPDLICQIDHLRHESRGLIPANVPHWCWVQDRLSHLFNPIAGSKVNDLEMVLGLGANLLATQHRYPESQCVPVLNGTDTHVYSAERLPEAELAPHRCDVAYVCNHSEPAAMLADTLIRRIANDAQERGFLIWVYDLLCDIIGDASYEPTGRIGRRRLLKIMQAESAGRFTVDGLNQVYDFFCLPLFDRMYRHQALEWVINYCKQNGRVLRLYGRGWEEHELTRPYACGEVENGRALRAVYQAARVNLHVSSFGSLHQRVFDGFASGAMVLCRRTAADAAYSLFRHALQVVDATGQRQFQMHEAPSFRKEWENVYGSGPTGTRRDRLIDLEHGPWHRFFEPPEPCHYRSYSQMCSTIDPITFWSEATLGQRLDDTLDHPEERNVTAAHMRQAIVTSLSLDVIAQYALTRYRQILRTAAMTLKDEPVSMGCRI